MNRRHGCGPPSRCSGWLPDGRVPASAGNGIISSPSRHAGRCPAFAPTRRHRPRRPHHSGELRPGAAPRVRTRIGQSGRIPVVSQSRFNVAAISRSFMRRASSQAASAVACARGRSGRFGHGGPRVRIPRKHAVCVSRTRFGCRIANFVGAICRVHRFTISFVAHVLRSRRDTASSKRRHAWPRSKSCCAGGPKRSNRIVQPPRIATTRILAMLK